MLTALEIVLGIDNIIFISILVGRIPPERRDKRASARTRLRDGFAPAVAVLAQLGDGLDKRPVHRARNRASAAATWCCCWGACSCCGRHRTRYSSRSRRARSTDRRPPTPKRSAPRATRCSGAVIGQIAVIDIVFSLDSVITAVGMVDQIGVMVAAIIVAVGVMLLAAKPIGDFVDRSSVGQGARACVPRHGRHGAHG